MDALWTLLVAPLVDYGFMRHALAVVVVVGITSSVLSCLLVVRRQALMGTRSLTPSCSGWCSAGCSAGTRASSGARLRAES